MRRGVIPLSIEVAQAKGQSKSLLQSLVRFKPAVSVDLTLLCRQMATITKAGVPLLSGLRTIAPGINDQSLRAALMNVADAMEGGESLAKSLSRHPEHFQRTFRGSGAGRRDQRPAGG